MHCQPKLAAKLIDLNNLLLFIAVASASILLARILRLRNPRNRGWKIAAILVLLACAGGWLLAPKVAGYVGGIFWALLLLLPSIAERKIDQALLARRWAWAYRLAILRQIFHPWNDSPHRTSVLAALELADRGRLDLAFDRLATEQKINAPAGRFATALTFALRENWDGLRLWCEGDPRVLNNPAVYTLYLRALGEVGAVDELIRELSARAEVPAPHLALALAFSGRISLLVRQFAGPLRRASPERQEFWLGTAELAGGQPENGRARLARLRKKTTDAVLQGSIDRRLGTVASGLRFDSSSAKLLDQLLIGSKRAEQTVGPSLIAGAPMVWTLILLNLAMFGLELLVGGGSSEGSLSLLGALEPEAVIVSHEYWRLLSALFLHYGVLHLAVNLFALYLLGPELERIIGSIQVSRWLFGGWIRFLSLGVDPLVARLDPGRRVSRRIGLYHGCNRNFGRAIFSGAKNSACPTAVAHGLIMVALQTSYDLLTPQVSLAAHLGGFVTGLALGLLLSRRRMPALES